MISVVSSLLISIYAYHRKLTSEWFYCSYEMQCYPSLVYKAAVHFPFMCCMIILLITATKYLTEAS